jgi:hypothetical protein
VPGSGLKRHRAFAVLPFPPALIIDCVLNMKHRGTWDPSLADMSRVPVSPGPVPQASAAAALAAGDTAPILREGTWSAVELCKSTTKQVLTVSSREFVDAVVAVTGADGSILAGGTGIEGDPR